VDGRSDAVSLPQRLSKLLDIVEQPQCHFDAGWIQSEILAQAANLTQACKLGLAEEGYPAFDTRGANEPRLDVAANACSWQVHLARRNLDPIVRGLHNLIAHITPALSCGPV
jgi:hypothetical protein